MVKYKRVTQTCIKGEDFENLFRGITSDGWEIVYYNEDSHNQSGDQPIYVHVTMVCKKSESTTTIL